MTEVPAPRPGQKKLGLVIDLDICVGCHACATACKSWNTSGHSAPLPDQDPYGGRPEGVWFNRIHTFEVEGRAYGPAAEVEGGACGPAAGSDGGAGGCGGHGGGQGGGVAGGRTVHFPRSCLHCEAPACVTVCPTGASYKRAEDGIVLVNAEICIGCKLCSWACPYGAREFDEIDGVMKKCTLCIDRIYNANLEEEDRIPACVQVCPVHARHFGDLGDPDSAISGLVRNRGGVDLMPELGYRPVNKYLPPRTPRPPAPAAARPAPPAAIGATGFWRLVDRLLGAGSGPAAPPAAPQDPRPASARPASAAPASR